MRVRSILDRLDEEAAEWYVEESGDLAVEVAERLGVMVTLLLEGRIAIEEADVLWPQWWATVTAFIGGYRLGDLEELREHTQGLRDQTDFMTEHDEEFLRALGRALNGYLAFRESGAPGRFGNVRGSLTTCGHLTRFRSPRLPQ